MCKMSERNEGFKDLNLVDNDPKVEVNDEPSTEEVPKHLEEVEDSPMPSPAQEEAVIKKKYGGLLPRKTPLISKDHDRAFFDSADWALGKQGSQKSKGPLEALRPKLQPTPHQQARSRRSAYAPADEGEDDGSPNLTATDDQGSELDSISDNKCRSEDENHPN
ncbi:uncharacterized protein LOC112527821 isoform X3 [Cynara cardunculus var. scolymus]|uniref:uncharacterized protein LOC112527821 isoform X3 n=1 Tax=Cynara cardunculus var. scolymus TaxID=59895 RepID=UPI000D62E23D|nr:uncharacterized protein LOC112527821 isoform X3 [Cynara cardunculus var. scolymus]XP_024994407.1 uncharacterized protein LOC112527821 isoform X3 [Cynara cardunculus var. scolymus]